MEAKSDTETSPLLRWSLAVAVAIMALCVCVGVRCVIEAVGTIEVVAV